MKSDISTTEVTKELFIKMAISAWETHNIRVTKLLDSLSDDQLLAETAPGRNRGVYLIGHLATVSDGLFALMGWGERLYPQYEVPFLKEADDKTSSDISVKDLRECWSNLHVKVTEHISKMKSDEWFTKHTAVSEEDFIKEPHRNKLNILINRTNHMSYHLGQLVYLVKK